VPKSIHHFKFRQQLARLYLSFISTGLAPYHLLAPAGTRCYQYIILTGRYFNVNFP